MGATRAHRADGDDTVLVVVGGGAIAPPPSHHGVASIIAADSGFDEALRIGITPHLLVGDLDSISPAGLAAARSNGTSVETHPRDKDSTDAALALSRAVDTGLPHLVVLGGDTVDRLDHLLGTIAALGDPVLAVFETITAYLGATTFHVLHPGRSISLDLSPGRVFSLVPAHGVCRQVSVRGARWPLDDADLLPGTTRGISNEAPAHHRPIDVRVAEGVLTVVVPPVRDALPHGKESR